MKRIVGSLITTLLLVLGVSSQIFGTQISFGYHYVDSNTYGYVTRATKETSSKYVSVDLDRILTASGKYTDYKYIKGRFYIATTAELLANDVTLVGSTSAGKLVHNSVPLKRLVPKGTSVSFFAMGNHPEYDCRIKGFLTVY